MTFGNIKARRAGKTPSNCNGPVGHHTHAWNPTEPQEIHPSANVSFSSAWATPSYLSAVSRESTSSPTGATCARSTRSRERGATIAAPPHAVAAAVRSCKKTRSPPPAPRPPPLQQPSRHRSPRWYTRHRRGMRWNISHRSRRALCLHPRRHRV